TFFYSAHRGTTNSSCHRYISQKTMTTRIHISLLFSLFIVITASAQEPTQTIRGTVVDKITQVPLPGANVMVLNSNPINGAATDVNGNFRITNVPVGNHSLKISFIGYKEMTLPAIVVNSGKEVVLPIQIEENAIQG